jgi:enamine deaminase RidA (YjgF/YER057c/UK114 family)
MAQHERISSGSKWEPVVGYSRAVKAGNTIAIAGTTASSPEGVVGGADAAAQAREILTRLTAVLEQAGATLHDTIRTRVYLVNIDDFDAVGQVHGEFFGEIRPALTMLAVAAMASPELLVEIELDAIIAE